MFIAMLKVLVTVSVHKNFRIVDGEGSDDRSSSPAVHSSSVAVQPWRVNLPLYLFIFLS